MSNQFRERYEDENTGTSHELTVTALPHACLEMCIRLEAPKAASSAKFTLHRYRVRALALMLNEWLKATEDSDEQNRV